MIKLNGVEIKPTMFPDKTSQVWKIAIPEQVAEVVWDFENEAEFIHLAQLKMLLDVYRISTTLELPYLPYARQDKPVQNDRTFALHTFARFLNNLAFDSVSVLDPHSRDAHIIYGLYPRYPTSEICKVYESTEAEIVVFPDTGAHKKYTEVLCQYNMPSIFGDKKRDEKTGYISKYEIPGIKRVPEKCLIVDDICDGGMTFILLAKALEEKGAKDITLFVTHGIFSKGLQVLRDAGIKRIFTAKGEQ